MPCSLCLVVEVEGLILTRDDVECRHEKFSFDIFLALDIMFNPKYAIEITKLAKVIAPWAFTNNHRLT